MPSLPINGLEHLSDNGSTPLVGVVNTAIRNHCESLDDLCKTHDLDATILTERLAGAGYDYMPGSSGSAKVEATLLSLLHSSSSSKRQECRFYN